MTWADFKKRVKLRAGRWLIRCPKCKKPGNDLIIWTDGEFHCPDCGFESFKEDWRRKEARHK